MPVGGPGSVAFVLWAGVSLLLLGCSANSAGSASTDEIRGTREGAADNVCAMPEVVSLWQQREVGGGDFPVGPGDVLEISVPEVDELQKQRVQVSGEGTVALPLLGTVQVGGLQESQLRQELLNRLARYMKHPRLELYIERERSRAVAVVGAVRKPGLYDLVSSRESLLDVLDQAGGLTADAAQRVNILPTGGTKSAVPKSFVAWGRSTAALETDATRSSASGPKIITSAASPVSVVAARPVEEAPNFITVDLSEGSSRGCLGLPARPGDALVVPDAGQVMVEGWVRNPGAFPISPGMTILGAVSAAGGAMFTWSARLLRTRPDGSRIIQEVSLTGLEGGREPDVPVQAGDVVVVEKSAVGAVPYAMEELFEHFATGLAFPIP